MNPRDAAVAIWQAGTDAVGGYAATARALGPDAPDMVLAVGKAAGSMARAALDRYGSVPALVVTKDGHAEGLPEGVRVIEAAHPVPDNRSLDGGRALREAVEGMAADSRLLLLVSGGASALAEDLREGQTLDDLTALNRAMLAEGLDITAMNARRRTISRIKGGGLLGHFRGASARVLSISDVPRDDIMVIGSGIGAAPDAPGFDYRCEIVASNAVARGAAEAKACDLGLAVLGNDESLYDDVTALADRVGPELAGMAPGVRILGGEPTVILPENPGRGGRNQALALALARHIAGQDGIAIVVAGTDGSDGPTDASGAVVDGTTWGDGAQEALARADSGSYLEAKGALLKTGPTGTNVMDLAVAVRI